MCNKNKPNYRVDQEWCIGCRRCYELADSNFEADPESRFGGRSKITKQPEDENEEFLCDEAFQACPADAIVKVVDGQGYDRNGNPTD